MAALCGLSLALGCTSEPVPEPKGLDLLLPNDHVVLVGGGLADRMQHDGWFETYLQAAKPDLQLVVRNHGYTGDRIDHRPRNDGFLSADEYLTHSGADVILAMFGYNEAFDDDPAGFEAKLVEWVQATQAKNYGGASPRIVLVSPAAAEDLGDPNLASAGELNLRLAAVTEATERAAAASGAAFLDLFSPTLHHFAMSTAAQTINGVHLNAEGNRIAGAELVKALCGSVPKLEPTELERLRAAVLDKNWHWFNRYRATDGNDVWGSRAGLAFTDGQTNRDVLQHELTQLDVMTANRDLVVWAAAKGEALAPDDSNVPPAVEVVTNLDKPQEQGGISKIGDGTYLSGKEGLTRMTIPDDLEANLFASEEMFPELVNPVQLGVGPAGRLWCAAWKTYPKWEPLKEMDDRILILHDDDEDGVCDRTTTFAKVHNPTAFEFWGGGVIVASAPDLIFLKDTDGDDVADVRYRILGGIDSADTHHAANNFALGPDGFLYYQRGVFHVSNVETPWGANQQSGTSGMYRFNPRTYEFSFHATNSPNPHGISFDRWGYHYATDGTGGRAYQVVPDYEAEGGGFKMRKLFDHTVRPVASSGILSSAHLPERYQGNFVLSNCIAFLGLKQYTLAFDTETGFATGTETEDLLVSTDPNFRPTDQVIGDDGAIYVSDWCNAIVGHMQHNVRDPERDHAHGRIYRLTAKGRPLAEHVDVVGVPTGELVRKLAHPVNGVRERVRAELSGRDSAEVVAAARAWAEELDPKEAADAHHLLEVLWLHQSHNVENRELLAALLASPEPHARVAAARVEYMWDHTDAAPAVLGEDGLGTPRPETPEGAIVIEAVPEKMLYDVTKITVKAGEPVKLWFYNPDFMPHNLVVGMPGSAAELGQAAEAMGASGFAKGFVPESDKILAASRLLNNGEAQLLEFTAPTEPGEYVYVCTFPGHWQRMRGVLVVE
ncbi:MAG: GDSL-type esterase/lipase family protein [Planctomycetota bacterium]|nr:GDSL-type esterase/lipase family protein [Planctomycetota bacterium]